MSISLPGPKYISLEYPPVIKAGQLVYSMKILGGQQHRAVGIDKCS